MSYSKPIDVAAVMGGGERFDLYVDSAGGNDANPGTLALPKKTLASLTGLISAGKKVAMKRGSTFREAWSVEAGGSAGNPVIYGAYGSGAKPKITGVDLLTGWANVPGSSALFADGFESGDLSKWSTSSGAGVNLVANATAKIIGNYGLAVSVPDTTNRYVQDSTPTNAKTYRCRFYIDPGTLAEPNAGQLIVLRAFNSGGTTTFYVALDFYTVGGFNLRGFFRDDSWASTTWNQNGITGPHYVECEWKASTAPGANNGIAALYIDGVQKGRVTNLDTDTLDVGYVQLGSVLQVPAGSSGTFYLDGFYSNNTGDLIGATDPVTVSYVYKAAYTESIDTYLLLQDNTALTRVANQVAVNGAGKYFPDNANNYIYAWCTDNADPSAHVMEIGARYDTVSCDNRSYVNFQDLEFHGAGGQYGRGFGLKRTNANPSNITLTRCEIDRCAYNGVQVNHVDGQTPVSNFKMYSCRVHDNLDTGVWIIGESAAAKITGLVVDGCQIYNNGLTTAASMGLFIQSCANPMITNNEIYGNNGNLDWSDNLLVGTSSDVEINHNLIHGGNHSGIHLDVNSNGSIWYNTIYSCAWNGIWFEEHQTAVCGVSTIYHNTVWDCLHGLVFGPGSTIREVSGVTVKNNIFSKCHRANIELNEDGVGPNYLNNTLDYNCYLADVTDPRYAGQFRAKATRENETFAQWKLYTSWDAHSVNADPLLINPPGDVSIPANSPCVGTGVFVVGVSTVNPANMGRV